MTRPYHRNEPEPVVLTEFVEPENIVYYYGKYYATLTGFLANLYRGMIWMYGEEEAKERFFYLFHKEPEKKRRCYPARQHRQIPAREIQPKEIIS